MENSKVKIMDIMHVPKLSKSLLSVAQIIDKDYALIINQQSLFLTIKVLSLLKDTERETYII